MHETMLADHDADATAEDDPLARFAAAPIPTEDDPGPATAAPTRRQNNLRLRPNAKKRLAAAAARRRFASDDSNDDDSCDDDVRDRAPPPSNGDPPPRAEDFDAGGGDDDDDARFEVDDAPVSEHSDGSQERTAGVKGLRMTELLGDGYGKGMRRRRRGEARARLTVADLIAARRGRKPLLDPPRRGGRRRMPGRGMPGRRMPGRRMPRKGMSGRMSWGDDDDGEEDDRDAYDDDEFSAFSRPPMDQEADIRADDGRVFAEELLAAARLRADPRDAASHRRRRRRQGRLDAFLSMNDDNRRRRRRRRTGRMGKTRPRGDQDRRATRRRTRPLRRRAPPCATRMNPRDPRPRPGASRTPSTRDP